VNELDAEIINKVLRVKSERDDAVRLLKEGLLYSHIGQHGSYKSRVREFLCKLGVIKDYADTMIKRDQLARHEGRADHDQDICGRPLREGS
jgi:hypothetical protein